MRGVNSKIRLVSFWGAIVLLFLSILFVNPQKTFALEWYENLISDSEFTASNSMSAQQIQNFLIANGSYLANYIIPEDRVPGDNNPQPGAGQKASDFIYWCAQNFGINPKVILVTLQKEESLITLANPSPIRLEWAMGYGYYSGSPYTDPNNPNYMGGFGRQVYWATAFFRNRFDNVGGKQGPGSSHVGDTVDIQTYSWQAGTTRVYLSTRATAVLYRYTPYIYNGNYNFYRLYNQWFNPSAPSWNFLLIKTADNPAVYFIDKGQKFLIPNMDVFNEWGFKESEISILSQSVLDSYPTANANLSLLVKGDGGDAVYLISMGSKRFIPTMVSLSLAQEIVAAYNITILSQQIVNLIPSGKSYVAFVKDPNNSYWLAYGDSKYQISTQMIPKWGMSEANAFSVSSVNLNNLTVGPNISDLIIPIGYQSVWQIVNGVRKWIPDMATLFALYTSQAITPLPLAILDLLPQSSNVSALVKGSGSAVYVTGDGTKHWIPNMESFNLFNYSVSNIRYVPDYILNIVPNGYPKFYLAKGSSATVYLIWNGTKKAIPDPYTFNSWRFSWETINTVSDSWLNRYPSGYGLRLLVKAYNHPAIYYLQNGTKRLIPNMNAFRRYGFCLLDMVEVDQFLLDYYYPNGPNM